MLNYLKGTLNRGLLYPYGGVPMLMRYIDVDWARNYTQGIQLQEFTIQTWRVQWIDQVGFNLMQFQQLRLNTRQWEKQQ